MCPPKAPCLREHRPGPLSHRERVSTYAMEVAGVKRAASDAPDEAGAADKLRRVDEGGAAEGAPPIVQQRRTCLHEVMTRTRPWLRIHTTRLCCRERNAPISDDSCAYF